MADEERDAKGAPESAVESRGPRRERVRVRRRRSRHVQEARRLVKAQARQRRARIIAFSTGFLLLMALGLYYGLSRANAGPGLQGAHWLTPLAPSTRTA